MAPWKWHGLVPDGSLSRFGPAQLRRPILGVMLPPSLFLVFHDENVIFQISRSATGGGAARSRAVPGPEILELAVERPSRGPARPDLTQRLIDADAVA